MRFIPETEAEALRTHLEASCVTSGSQLCPKVASLAHQAAVEHADVTADVIEISEFPDLAAQYHVRGVPKIVMNDTVELVGAQPEAAFVDAMLSAAA